MLRGIYASATGLIQESQRLEVIANNLANASTTGYKRDTLVSTPFHDLLVQRLHDSGSPPLGDRTVGHLGLGTLVAMTCTRLADGSLQYTGRELDVALLGNGFFTVRTPQGLMYTRNGSFVQDGEGRLVTAEGYPVMVDGNELVRPGEKLSLNDQGEVFANGVRVGRLDIVAAEQLGPLRKVGHNLYSPDGQGAHVLFTPRDQSDPRGSYQLRVGYLETSNVTPVLEMVQLIGAVRAYESNQKALQVQDETLGKAVNEAGRV